MEVSDPKGLLKTYEDSDTTTGNTVHRSFCSNCGSPVFSAMGPDTPQIILKGGLFDEIPEPGFENFPQTKPAWMTVANL